MHAGRALGRRDADGGAARARRALHLARGALVVLLFGTMCGCLAAIQETGARACELAGLGWLDEAPEEEEPGESTSS